MNNSSRPVVGSTHTMPDGKTYRVKKVPMKTGKKKFSRSTSADADNSQSPLDRFYTHGGSRHTSL